MYLEQGARRREHEWEQSVVAVNQGLATYYNRKANAAWQRRTARSRSVTGQAGLTGAALERKVLSLAMTNPEYVVVQ